MIILPKLYRDYGWLIQPPSVGSLPKFSNIVFSADFNSNITPSIGAAGSFARASAINYANTTSTITSKSAGNPCIPAFPFGGSGADGGIQIQGARTNLCTRSEDLTNAAWTVVGTLSVRTNVGITSPDTSITSTTQITGSSANSGLQFDSGVTAVSKTFCFSVYCRSTFGGNVTCNVVIKDGGVETATTSFTATGTWQRKDVSITFTAGAAGNCFAQVIIPGSGSGVQWWGAQIERLDVDTPRNAKPSPYITSNSGATTASVADNLNYPSTDIAVSSGTISAWVCPNFSQAQVATGLASVILSMSSFGLAFYLTTGNFESSVNGRTHAFTTSWGANTWMLMSWDFDDPTNTTNWYQNGAFGSTTAAPAFTAPAAAAFNIGILSTLAGSTAFDGLIGRMHIWNTVLSATEHLQIYNMEKGNYGL